MYGLIDIGGTKTRISVSRDLEHFSSPITQPTPQKFEDGMELLCHTLSEMAHGEQFKAIAIGIAASPDKERTTIVAGGPNIADWLNKPIVRELGDRLGAKVYIENDTAMGGLAQVHYGPAKGSEIAVYVTVSTGVGGCRFVDGKIDKGTMGFEPGWQIIGHPEGEDPTWLNGYCSQGYLMSHIGGVCTERMENKKPYEITDAGFWDKKAHLLAYGLHNICTMWSPDTIVVGGSMMKEIGIPLDKTEGYLTKTLKHVFPATPRIVKAEFGDEMGLYGAMAYLKQK